MIWAANACSRASSPTSPSTLSTQPAPTLFGLVFAETPSGPTPVGGARVRLEIGSFRQEATTDQNGLYPLSGLREDVAISGDVQLDIELVRR